MTPTTRRSALSVSLLALGVSAALGFLGGCAGARQPYTAEPDAKWVRWSRPDFVELNHETLFTLAHSPDRASLIYEQTVEGDRYLPVPRTWLLTLPESPSMLTPIELSEDGPNNGWLLARIGADPTGSFPVRGRISVISSDAESLTAQVNISAIVGPASAGYAAPPEISLDARVVFVNATPQTAQPARPATTSGVPFVAPKKPKPIRE